MASNEQQTNNKRVNHHQQARRLATNRKLIDDQMAAGPQNHQESSSDETTNKGGGGGAEAFGKQLDGTMLAEAAGDRQHWPRVSRFAPLSAEHHKSQSHEIDLNNDENKQRQARVGPMGIFFKVWSLVKVTKARHNHSTRERTRRQTSEDTGQFHFISGDQLGAATSGPHASTSGGQGATTSTLMSSGPSLRPQQMMMALRDSHFRRAGSQPAPSRLQVIDTTNQQQPAPVSTTSSTSSSGVSSSTSSTLVAAAVAVAAAEKQKKRPPRAELYRSRRAAESTQSFALTQSRARLNQSSEESDLNGDDDDIYSTPNDSIQSVPSSQLGELNGGGGAPSVVRGRQRRASSGHQLAIVKSFSTQNFAAQQLRALPTARRQSSELQDNNKKSARASVSTSSSSSTSKTTTATTTAATNQVNGSRFFISSSSSSEDSNLPPVPQVQTPPPPPPVQSSRTNRVGQLDQRVQIPVHFALHQHRPHPPDSLLLLHGGGGGAPVNLLTPTGSGGNCQLIQKHQLTSGYRKSPSLFEISANRARFSSKYPTQATTPPTQMSTFLGQRPAHLRQQVNQQPRPRHLPNSSSMHDCKLVQTTTQAEEEVELNETGSDIMPPQADEQVSASEYKLAHILLQLGANPTAKDQSDGSTALMLAIRSENLPAIRCLIDHGVNLNECNRAGLSALDLICSRPATSSRLEMFKLLLENRADFDSTRASDNSRLLDRLIAAHDSSIAPETMNKLPFIEMLLHNGAKLGSSTWAAASGKLEIQLRLLKKLCQDGYFIYKQNSTRVESAIYRFEYALRRVSQLEQQLFGGCDHRTRDQLAPTSTQIQATQQLKYQVYLGLSRCERKRRLTKYQKFFKRALEYANMTILIDSTSYEGYYSKAHILKDIGELDDALITIDQTDRLVQKSIEHLRLELNELQQQEESLVFDKCFQVHDPNKSINWIEANRAELISNLDYLEEARKHIGRLRGEILEDKKSTIVVADSPTDNNNNVNYNTSTPIDSIS